MLFLPATFSKKKQSVAIEVTNQSLRVKHAKALHFPIFEVHIILWYSKKIRIKLQFEIAYCLDFTHEVKLYFQIMKDIVDIARDMNNLAHRVYPEDTMADLNRPTLGTG